MRVGYKGKQFTLHRYEIELRWLLEKLTYFLDRVPPESFKSSTPAIMKKALLQLFSNYETKNNIQPEWEYVIIEANDPGFDFFLTINLVLMDPLRIPLFLSYHKNKYVKGIDFASLVEFGVYDMLDRMMPLDHKDIQERILKWVYDSKKTDPAKTKPASKVEASNSLTWSPTYLIALKKISKRLWKEKFTKRQSDFEKVFTEGKKIEWRKDAELLCYLLYKLRNNDPALFKATKGKGHYQLAATFFTDVSRKLAKKNYIPDTIYKFKIRHTGKPMPERVLIDNMIKLSVGK